MTGESAPQQWGGAHRTRSAPAVAAQASRDSVAISEIGRDISSYLLNFRSRLLQRLPHRPLGRVPRRGSHAVPVAKVC
jgi:hypothetical protein